MPPPLFLVAMARYVFGPPQTVLLNTGDIAFWRGDVVHCGSPYDTHNVRFFADLSTPQVVHAENTVFFVEGASKWQAGRPGGHKHAEAHTRREGKGRRTSIDGPHTSQRESEARGRTGPPGTAVGAENRIPKVDKARGGAVPKTTTVGGSVKEATAALAADKAKQSTPLRKAPKKMASARPRPGTGTGTGAGADRASSKLQPSNNKKKKKKKRQADTAPVHGKSAKRCKVSVSHNRPKVPRLGKALKVCGNGGANDGGAGLAANEVLADDDDHSDAE